jgi:AcrR family transcriptional regulator
MAQAPVRQTRAEKKAETRERLLRATEAIARDQGFAKITLEAVATAAGLTKGAIYSNFASKEELMLEVLSRLTPGLNLTAELEDAPDLPSMLERAAALLPAAARTSAKQAALMTEFEALAMRDPALRKAINRVEAEERARDPDEIERWFEERGIELPIPAAQYVRVVNALGMGLMNRRILHGQADMPDELIAWALGRLASFD